jgi:D-3-phosphoglycerate dehydrogenase/microcystin synthetase protein McyI
MTHRVLLVEPLYDIGGEELLRRHADVELLRRPNRADVIAAASRANGICARYPNRIDEEVIAGAEDLVIIATSGRGTDAVDIEAATRHGVAVANNPGFGRIPVSEHALTMLLALARHLPAHDRMLREGRGWQDRLAGPTAIIDIEGRTLGIVGLGEIGSEMARKCIAAFNMKVLAYDPYVDPAAAKRLGVTLLPRLEQVLEGADYVSVHAELNRETHHMFNAAAFARMQPHACLINTARGKIVEEAALAAALAERRIRAAALDVFEEEPVGPGSRLTALDNIILSPHVGGLSESFLKGSAIACATHILEALRGIRPASLVNPEAWDRAMQRAARVGMMADG